MDSIRKDYNIINKILKTIFNRYGFDYGSVYSTIIEGLSEYQWAPQIYNAFMFFWVETFIIGFNQMV